MFRLYDPQPDGLRDNSKNGLAVVVDTITDKIRSIEMFHHISMVPMNKSTITFSVVNTQFI